MAVLVLVLYIQVKIMSIYSFILIFPDQTIMAQSGNGPESESDVTSLCTGRQLQLLILYHQKAFNMRNLRRSEIKDTERKKTVIR